MNRLELVAQIREKKSFLCVGLDSDISRIPNFLFDFEDPVFEFNKRIIDATKAHCVAYKPNIAFYESQGSKGWAALEKTLAYIPETHFTIADAKRGDIGNTSKQYAQTFFKYLNFDSVTVAPYMGVDSVSPFLEFEDKWVILLGLTSNKGSQDFQHFKNQEGVELYEQVLKTSQEWGSIDNLMYVIGATHPESFVHIRSIVPDHFLLVPGVGAQGGSLEGVCEYGMNKDCSLLVNSSRGIIFSGKDENFDQAAKSSAAKLHQQMGSLLSE